METPAVFNLPVAEMLVDTVPVDTEGPAVQAELDTQIESTHFTVGQVVSLMTGKDSEWDALVSTRELKDVVVQRISIGFLSFVARISFHFDGLDEPYSVILKVPSTENVVALNNNVTQEYLESFAVVLAECHDREVCLYENLNSANLSVGVPNLYASRTCGDGERSQEAILKTYMVMEDLGARGAMADIVAGLSREQIENGIRAIATFHASSLAMPNREQVLDTIRPTKPSFEKGNFDQVCVMLPNLHESFRRHSQLLMEKVATADLVHFHSHVPFGTPPVLCHGDYWSNNIFYEKKPDGTASDKVYAVCDFQMAHPGTGLLDFCRLVFNCANSSMKLRHIDEWLRLYYDTFVAACKSAGVKCPYTWDLVVRMYHYQCTSELLVHFVLIGSYLERVTDEKLRTSLLSRVLSTFEMILLHLTRDDLDAVHLVNRLFAGLVEADVFAKWAPLRTLDFVSILSDTSVRIKKKGRDAIIHRSGTTAAACIRHLFVWAASLFASEADMTRWFIVSVSADCVCIDHLRLCDPFTAQQLQDEFFSVVKCRKVHLDFAAHHDVPSLLTSNLVASCDEIRLGSAPLGRHVGTSVVTPEDLVTFVLEAKCGFSGNEQPGALVGHATSSAYDRRIYMEDCIRIGGGGAEQLVATLRERVAEAAEALPTFFIKFFDAEMDRDELQKLRRLNKVTGQHFVVDGEDESDFITIKCMTVLQKKAG